MANTIGEQIKKYRKERGMTQKQLASLLGTTQQNLAQYENGKRNPKLSTILHIASVLDVPPEMIDLSYAITSYNIMQKAIQRNPGGMESYQGMIDETLKNVGVTNIEELKNIVSTQQKTPKTTSNTECLDNIFFKLNEEGQEKVIEYATDLSQNPRYKKN